MRSKFKGPVVQRRGQVDGSTTRPYEGSGLGLAIVKGFADAMGMMVSVEDDDLGGARFVLGIPA